MAFGLYLPGIELFLDFRLFEPLCDERQMLFEAIDNLRADDVLLLDRGFPCRWLVSALTARGIPFCIRCDLSRGFKAVREFMRSGQSEQLVVLQAPDARDAADYECPATPTTVRLVRVVTPTGRIHVVMTSLFDPLAFPVAAFADLYHGRWRIEEVFKRIKSRLGLEHTSGLSWHAAHQDFGAKAVFDNLNALAAYVATDALIDPDSPYKINRTLAIDKIKRQIGRWLLTAAATPRRLKPLLKELALNLQKLVPHRSQPRKPQPKPHHTDLMPISLHDKRLSCEDGLGIGGGLVRLAHRLGAVLSALAHVPVSSGVPVGRVELGNSNAKTTQHHQRGGRIAETTPIDSVGHQAPTIHSIDLAREDVCTAREAIKYQCSKSSRMLTGVALWPTGVD